MRTTPWMVFTLSVGLACSGAQAQRALGDGKALDSNLKSGSSGRNAPARNLMKEFKLRNAIVTGRAPDGMSFRGDVGYTAADDFRDTVAGDTLFSFERDSYRSALTGRGARGIDALKLQMQLTIGGFVGEGDFLPSVEVKRSEAGTTAGELANARHLTSEFGSRDPLAYREGTLRATSEFLARESDTPVLLRVLPAENEGDQNAFSVATPLRGVATQDAVRFDRRLSDMLESAESAANRIENTGTPDQSVSNRIDANGAVYDEILNRVLRTPAADDTATGPAPDPASTESEDTSPEIGDTAPGEPLVQESEFLTKLREMREALMRPNTETPEYGGSDSEEPDATEELRQKIAESAESIFEGSVIDVDSIAPPADESVDLYANHMAKGQSMLALGKWFAAEERFTSALGVRPGDPMAAAGRVNAQIGGGMFLSAGMNLQKLFRAHPELINVRYSNNLLPSGERLDEVLALLKSRMRGDDDFARGAALVHAYLGFQAADADRIAEGLDRIAEIDRAAGRQPEALLTVLRAAWGEAP